MTIQQVNLYQDELRPQKLKYSSRLLLQVCVVLLITMSAASVFKYVQLQQQQAELVTAKENNKNALAELAKLQAEFAKVKKDKSLLQQVAEKNKELSNKQKVLKILSQDKFGNTDGFIQHISGLARQRIEGLWLTQIRIASGGSDLALQGSTLKSSLLPKYLQRLSDEKAFSGTEFESLLMDRDEKKKDWLNFSLKNISSTEVAAK